MRWGVVAEKAKAQLVCYGFTSQSLQPTLAENKHVTVSELFVTVR
jgi:hypothetical protein